MTDAPDQKFEEVVKRLLSTPPKPHTATKAGRGKDDESKVEKRTVGKSRRKVGAKVRI